MNCNKYILYIYIHGLSFSERWMLPTDVALYARSRFESHGTAGAFVEHITVGLLDVRLHRVQPAEHHQATGTPARWRKSCERERTHTRNSRGCSDDITPVSNASGKVQTGLVEVRSE